MDIRIQPEARVAPLAIQTSFFLMPFRCDERLMTDPKHPNDDSSESRVETKSNQSIKSWGLGLPLGLALGAGVGAAMGNVGVGVAIGISIGIGLGFLGGLIQAKK